MIDVLSFLLAFLGGFVPAYTINHPVPVIIPPSTVLSLTSTHQLAGGSAGAGSSGSFFTVLVVPDSGSSFHYVEVIYGADKPASISANLSNLSTICAYIRFPKLPSGYKDEYPSIKLWGRGVTFITRLKERVLTVTPRGPAFVYRDVLVHASQIIFYNTSEIRLYPPSAFSWDIVPTKKKGAAWRLISFYAGNMTLYVFASGVGPVLYTGQLNFSKSSEVQWIQLWDKANNFLFRYREPAS